MQLDCQKGSFFACGVHNNKGGLRGSQTPFLVTGPRSVIPIIYLISLVFLCFHSHRVQEEQPPGCDPNGFSKPRYRKRELAPTPFVDWSNRYDCQKSISNKQRFSTDYQRTGKLLSEKGCWLNNCSYFSRLSSLSSFSRYDALCAIPHANWSCKGGPNGIV